MGDPMDRLLDRIWDFFHDTFAGPIREGPSLTVTPREAVRADRRNRRRSTLPSDEVLEDVGGLFPEDRTGWRVIPSLYRPPRPLTPFETNASFFGSGDYRPTAYVISGDRDEAPDKVTGARRRGMYTGAARPDPMKVFRRFGNQTRARVMPYRRYNHMDAKSGFADDVVGSQSVPSLLNPTASLGQSGSEAVLTASRLSRTLGVGKPGSTHPILDG